MKVVYVVSMEKGFVRFFDNEQAAKECVEHFSVVDFGMRKTEEIFEDRWGNQSVWYGMYELFSKFE